MLLEGEGAAADSEEERGAPSRYTYILYYVQRPRPSAQRRSHSFLLRSRVAPLLCSFLRLLPFAFFLAQRGRFEKAAAAATAAASAKRSLAEDLTTAPVMQGRASNHDG